MIVGQTREADGKVDVAARLIQLSLTLLLLPQEFSRGGVDRDAQLGAHGVGSVDHMPGEFVGLAIPIEDVQDRRVGSFLQQFFAAMLLGDFQRLTGVDFEEGHVKNGGAAVARTIRIFDAE